MPDDPIFDDDSLTPDWLHDMDAGWGDEPAQDSASQAPAAGPRPPWEVARGESPPQPQGPAPQPPPWEMAGAPAAPLPTAPAGPSPWDIAAPAESAAPSGLFDEDYDWETQRPDAAVSGSPGGEIPRGLTGELPWMAEDTSGLPQDIEPLPDTPWATDMLSPAKPTPADEGPSEPFTMSGLLSEFEADTPEEPPPPQKQPSLRDRLLAVSADRSSESEQGPEPVEPTAADAEWLSAFGQAAEYEDSVPADDETDLAWLTGDSAEPEDSEPSLPGDAELPDWLAPEDKPATGIRRIQPEHEEPADETLPEWMQTDDFSDVDLPDTGELTYDEWEQTQIEEEQEAQKTPEERMMEQLPDWFDELETPEAAPAADEPERPSKPEFMPDWFLGLDEQNVEEAPDWFQKLDYSTDMLAEPPQEPAEPAPAADEEALPDWFTGGDLPETSGADWASAFGAPPTPPPAQEADLPLPDMDFLTGGTEEAAAPGEVPDWLAAAAPESSRMAGPEDIPFPELDLEETLADTDEGIAGDDEAWMAQFAPTESTPAAGPEPSGAPVEDFVERFEPDMPETFAEAPPVDEEAPDWLREMADSGEVLPVPPDVFATESPEDISTGEAHRPGAADEESLDWLFDISADDLGEAQAPPETASVHEPEAELFDEQTFDSGGIDQLLGLYQPSEAEPEAEPEFEPEAEAPPGDEALEAGFDDWLAEAAAGDEPLPDAQDLFGFAEEAEPPTPEEQPVSAEPEPDLDSLFAEVEAGDMLPGMEELFPAEEEPADEEPAPEPPSRPTVQPEWLAEMRPSDLPVTVKAGGSEAQVTQKQVVELPDRLRAFREKTMRDLPQPAAQPAAESGPLAGIAGALPLIDFVSPHPTAHVEGLVVTPEQQGRADRLQALLDQMAAEEEEAETIPTTESGTYDFSLEPEEAAVRQRVRRQAQFKPDRVIITLLLLVALLVPFATDALNFSADPSPLSGERQRVADAIDALQANDLVLFAFEYGPVASGELDGLAEAVLRDVLAHDAKPLTTSTNPVAAFHVEAVVAPLVDDARLLAARGQNETSLTAGEDYYVLGFLPGEAVGVRALTTVREDDAGNLKQLPAFETNLRGDKTNLAIGSLENNIALIVVIGADSDAVRTWVEQLDDVSVPKVALVPAALEPLTIPYVNDTGYMGYLAGYRDTYTYNKVRNANSRTPYEVPDDISFDIPNPEESRWHSIALGAALAAGLVALGMVVNLLRALRRRSQP
jgi:hypothetical protein